jgi:hypothetical protein
MSKSTVHRILKDELALFPYKIQVHQLLRPFDIERRLEFASLMIEKIEAKQIDPKKIWFTDEAHCDLHGYVNKQKYRHWGTQKPEFCVSKPLHSQRLTVWCAISASGIIGPYFLTETITRLSYREQILKKFIPEAKRKKMVRDYWFQQDGARPHRTEDNLNLIANDFGARIIGLDAEKKTGEGMDWPPYSADMTVCDFFLWGYMKDEVFRERPENLEQLQERITEVIHGIPDDMRRRACDAFEARLRHLIASGGSHFEQMIH